MNTTEQLTYIRSKCVEVKKSLQTWKLKGKNNIRKSIILPIQLSDVLLAIGEKKEKDDDYNPILVSEGGSFYFHNMDNSDIEGYELEHLAHWNLLKDLDHQSPEVLQFLYELLK